MNKTSKFIIPFLILFSLVALLWHQLFYHPTEQIPSALIGEPVPAFHLQNLYNADAYVTPKKFQGQAVLINVWASWCYACKIEMPMLMKIKNMYGIPIYGINYKDNSDDAKKWLTDNGNPYVMIGMDPTGDTAIDFGIYGTPETFVISPQGKIVYRHMGVIDRQNWENVLYPIFKKFRAQ